jgi:hypothetical protein
MPARRGRKIATRIRKIAVPSVDAAGLVTVATP